MNFNKYKNIKKIGDISTSENFKNFLSNETSELKLKNYSYNKDLKRLFSAKKKSLGRSRGLIVSAHRGGGVKRKFRNLSLYNHTKNEYGIIKSISYDPNRSAFIGLIQQMNGSFFYTIVSSNSYENQILKFHTDKNLILKSGDILKLKFIPKGINFHNVEKYPGSGPIYSKAAGSNSILLKKQDQYGTIKLTSKQQKDINLNCFVSLGIASNKYKKFSKKYKAGTNRLLNKRPIVRGVAMNPIDHPHGGGEGKGRPGRPSVSP